MKGYRTILTNALAALPIVAEVVSAMHAEGLGDIMPDHYIPIYTLLVILANVYLRTITTTPLGRRE